MEKSLMKDDPISPDIMDVMKEEKSRGKRRVERGRASP